MRKFVECALIILAVLLLEAAMGILAKNGFSPALQMLLRLAVWLPLMRRTVRLFRPNQLVHKT